MTWYLFCCHIRLPYMPVYFHSYWTVPDQPRRGKAAVAEGGGRESAASTFWTWPRSLHYTCLCQWHFICYVVPRTRFIESVFHFTSVWTKGMFLCYVCYIGLHELYVAWYGVLLAVMQANKKLHFAVTFFWTMACHLLCLVHRTSYITIHL